MIEMRWREVEHPMSQRKNSLTVPSGPWSFVLEYREWVEKAKSYSAWTEVPVVWLGQIEIGGGAKHG